MEQSSGRTCVVRGFAEFEGRLPQPTCSRPCETLPMDEPGSTWRNCKTSAVSRESRNFWRVGLFRQVLVQRGLHARVPIAERLQFYPQVPQPLRPALAIAAVLQPLGSSIGRGRCWGCPNIYLYRWTSLADESRSNGWTVIFSPPDGERKLVAALVKLGLPMDEPGRRIKVERMDCATLANEKKAVKDELKR